MTLKIGLKNGETLEIVGASRYYIDEKKNALMISAGEYPVIFNFDEVLYVGRKVDICQSS